VQDIIDALNRLRNAQLQAEKKKHIQFAAGAIAGALAGGVTGSFPNHAWDYVDGLSTHDMEDWADEAETAAENATWPSED